MGGACSTQMTNPDNSWQETQKETCHFGRRRNRRKKGYPQVDLTDTICENADWIRNYNTVNTVMELRNMQKAGNLDILSYYNKEELGSRS